MKTSQGTQNWSLKDEEGFKDRNGQRGNSTWEGKDGERHESKIGSVCPGDSNVCTVSQGNRVAYEDRKLQWARL